MERERFILQYRTTCSVLPPKAAAGVGIFIDRKQNVV